MILSLEPLPATIHVPVDIAERARVALNRAAFPDIYGRLTKADRIMLAELDDAIYGGICADDEAAFN